MKFLRIFKKVDVVIRKHFGSGRMRLNRKKCFEKKKLSLKYILGITKIFVIFVRRKIKYQLSKK